MGNKTLAPLVVLLVLLGIAWVGLFGLAQMTSTSSQSPIPEATEPSPGTGQGDGTGGTDGTGTGDGLDGYAGEGDTSPGTGTGDGTSDGTFLDRLAGRDGPHETRPRQDTGTFLDRLAGRGSDTDAGNANDTGTTDTGSTGTGANENDGGGFSGFFDRFRSGDGGQNSGNGTTGSATGSDSVSAGSGGEGNAAGADASGALGGPNERLMIVLDASGSMARADGAGGTSMTAAQDALDDVLADLDPQTQVGLRVFGSEVDSGGVPTQEACTDTRLVADLAPLARSDVRSRVHSFSPVGETPIGLSLERAVDDLGTTGSRQILLVSDGEESCRPDPCQAVQQARDAGVDVRIHTVGVRVDSSARDQLQCIAEAGGGSFTEATSDAEIGAAMRQAFARLGNGGAAAERGTGTTGETFAGSQGGTGTDTTGTGTTGSGAAQNSPTATDANSGDPAGLSNRGAFALILVIALLALGGARRRR